MLRIGPRPAEGVDELPLLRDEERPGEGRGIVGHPRIDLSLVGDEGQADAGESGLHLRGLGRRARQRRHREDQRAERDHHPTEQQRPSSHAGLLWQTVVRTAEYPP